MQTSSAVIPSQDSRRAAGMAIVREWKGRLPTRLATRYIDLMNAHAIPDYHRTQGNLAAFCLSRRFGSVTEVTMLSIWENYQSIIEFTGDDISTAKYYDFDPEFLLEMDNTVQHYALQDCFVSMDLFNTGSA